MYPIPKSSTAEEFLHDPPLNSDLRDENKTAGQSSHAFAESLEWRTSLILPYDCSPLPPALTLPLYVSVFFSHVLSLFALFLSSDRATSSIRHVIHRRLRNIMRQIVSATRFATRSSIIGRARFAARRVTGLLSLFVVTVTPFFYDPNCFEYQELNNKI